MNVPCRYMGAIRLHAFATYECRLSLAGRRVLSALIHTSSFRCGEVRQIPATQTRGALAALMVEVTETRGFRYRSGFERSTPDVDEMAGTVERALGSGKRTGARSMRHESASDARSDSISLFQFTLCQERRPPLAGCWRVMGIFPVREHLLFGSDSDAAG